MVTRCAPSWMICTASLGAECLHASAYSASVAARRLRTRLPVRAENLVHGSDQQSCPASRPAVMIAGHVPAVRLPPDQARGLMAAAVPARGGTEDRRDPDPAPPARRAAAAAAAPPEAELGGPGPARDPAGRDTQHPPPRAAAAGHPGHDPAPAPRSEEHTSELQSLRHLVC